MGHNPLDYIYNIEEEDLLINETIQFIDENISTYFGQYLDIEIVFVVFFNEELLTKEIIKRFKTADIYFPTILGKCNNSTLGNGLILEKINSNVSNLLVDSKEVRNENAQFLLKIDIIYSLISFYDFCNSRGLFLSSLKVEEISYFEYSKKIKVSKNLFKNIFRNEDTINYPPEIFEIKNLYSEEFAIKISNPESNSWNLGLLIYEILAGKHFIEKTEKQINKLDVKLITTKINSLQCNQYLKNLLKKLLKIDKNQRSCAKLIKESFNKKLIVDGPITGSVDKESKLIFLICF